LKAAAHRSNDATASKDDLFIFDLN